MPELLFHHNGLSPSIPCLSAPGDLCAGPSSLSCTEGGTLSETFTMSSSFFQESSAPSPTLISGAIGDHAVRIAQELATVVCALSHCDLKPISPLPGITPISTSMRSRDPQCEPTRRRHWPRYTRGSAPTNRASASARTRFVTRRQPGTPCGLRLGASFTLHLIMLLGPKPAQDRFCCCSDRRGLLRF